LANTMAVLMLTEINCTVARDDFVAGDMAVEATWRCKTRI